MEIKIDLFLFNPETDYLPYYKKLKVDIGRDEPATNLLALLKDRVREFNYNPQRPFFKINGKVVDKSVTIDELTDRFGDELTIEPLSIYRAVNSLEIDDSNFYRGLELLKEFCDFEDENFYNSLYGVFYASETFNFNKEYIGDAVLILADRLINKDRANEEKILDIISQENGLWDAEYENNMFHKTDFTETFDSLKSRVEYPPRQRVLSLFARGYRDYPAFDEVKVAIYGDEELKEQAEKLGFNTISYDAQDKKCGISLVDTNEKMALLKAGRVLSSAFDSGASILIVEDEKVLNYFKNKIGKIEKVLNRELPINLLSIEELSNSKKVA